jgi:hypothetical protein
MRHSKKSIGADCHVALVARSLVPNLASDCFVENPSSPVKNRARLFPKDQSSPEGLQEVLSSQWRSRVRIRSEVRSKKLKPWPPSCVQ